MRRLEGDNIGLIKTFIGLFWPQIVSMGNITPRGTVIKISEFQEEEIFEKNGPDLYQAQNELDGVFFWFGGTLEENNIEPTEVLWKINDEDDIAWKINMPR